MAVEEPKDACSREDYLQMSEGERDELAGAFLAMLTDTFADAEFGYESFPQLRYDKMVLSTIFSDLKTKGHISPAGFERFRLTPEVRRTTTKCLVRPIYPDWMLPTIPPEGLSFEADEDCEQVPVGHYDCPVCHKCLGDLPSGGSNVVIRFHREHGVYYWWSIVPHCGKKFLVGNSGV